VKVGRESGIWMSVFWHWASNIRLRILINLKVHAIVSLRSVLWDQWLSHLHLDLNWMGILGMRGSLKTSWVMWINLGKLFSSDIRPKWLIIWLFGCKYVGFSIVV